MADSAAQQVLDVRAGLAHALGTAENDRDTARGRLVSAVERRDRIATAAETQKVKLAVERDRRLIEIDHQHHDNLAALSGAAAAASRRAAPGAAGSTWEAWAPTPADVAPELRVGRLLLPYEGQVPALVPLLDRGHVLVRGADSVADELVAGLLLRALGTAAPGRVTVTGYDPENLGGGLAGFAPLAAAGVLTFVGPGGLSALLDDLVENVRRINETVLAGEHPSLRALAAATGRRPEPWRIAVLLGGGELNKHERGQLDRLLRTGAACGVHLIIRELGQPAAENTMQPGLSQPAAENSRQPRPTQPAAENSRQPRRKTVATGPGIEVVAVAPDGRARLSGCGDLPVRLDPGPPPALITRASRQIADTIAAGPAPVALDSLLPAEEWRESSASALTAPLGDSPQGNPVEVTLSDYPPHALIAGPSGTGKTNLIYAWMGALAARYSPAELAFYLLDFKEGVSFARFAPGRRDPSWLPHVRLVGVNVNTDREFGLALLRFLGAELRRRADAAKQHEVTNLAELRAEDPGGHWPRIVAVVDEFQVLLSGRDAVAGEAVDLLEDLARRGRSQGIHLVLASQDVSGIEALWGRPALVAQFSLRIALPRARRILAETNHAAEALPRYHAVVNADSGAVEANRVVRVPAAGDRERWSELQHRLWRHRPQELSAPRLFDGDAIPRLSDSPDFTRFVAADTVAAPLVLLGETIDVAARSARTILRRAPGRSLAVLGTRVDEACAILGTAARSLAAQFTPGAARFSVACLDADASASVESLKAELPGDTGWFDTDSVGWLLEDAAEAAEDSPATRPHFILVYAVDAAPGGKQTAEHLRRILRQGPERRIHLLGWWRGAALLRETLGGQGSRTDAIGAWVALDVHGSELAPFYPGAGAPAWYPRPWRALHFDRSVHRGAEVIIPYGPTP